MSTIDLERYAHQSPYSSPGRHADRLAALPDDLVSLCAASRNVIAHDRAEVPDLPERRRGEIDSRWLETILDLDQQRHPVATAAFDEHDIPAGPDTPFETAAQAWLGWQAGARDLSTYGVAGAPALSGPDFVKNYVIFEVAHRYGDEMLLWDGWGATEEEPSDQRLIDEVADLLVRADADDTRAEADLWARYHEDDRLRPGSHVVTYSPYGLPPRTVDLTTRS